MLLLSVKTAPKVLNANITKTMRVLKNIYTNEAKLGTKYGASFQN